MDIMPVDDYLYYTRYSTPATLVQEMAYQASGGRRVQHASPIAEITHGVHFSIPDTNIHTTIPIQDRFLTAEEDQALWRALRSSAKLISKGRLKNK